MWNMQSRVKRYSKHIYLNKFSLENGKQIIITNILGSVTMYHMQKKMYRFISSVRVLESGKT